MEVTAPSPRGRRVLKTIEDVIDWLKGWEAQGAVLMECRITPYVSPTNIHELSFKGRLIDVPPNNKKGDKRK